MFNNDLWLNYNSNDTSMRTCSLCLGKQALTLAHSRSVIHLSNMNRLPNLWWRLTDEQIYAAIHKTKKKNNCHFGSH